MNSKIGLDYRFWSNMNKDKIYDNTIYQFCFLHAFFFIALYSLLLSIVTDPGKLHPEYLRLFNLNSRDHPIIDDHKISIIVGILNQEKESKKPDVDELATDLFFDLLSASLDSFHHDLFAYIKKNTCWYCKAIKPMRTHHCKKCRSCVLKMDHHCSVLNFCIGLRNYKLYIVFLFYAIITLSLVISTIVPSLSYYIREYEWKDPSTKVVFGGFLAHVVVLIGVVDLFIFHLVLIMKGQTTIEYVSNESVLNSYFDNLTKVLGRNLFFWIIPCQIDHPVHDGYLEQWENNCLLFLKKLADQMCLEKSMGSESREMGQDSEVDIVSSLGNEDFERAKRDNLKSKNSILKRKS